MLSLGSVEVPQFLDEGLVAGGITPSFGPMGPSLILLLQRGRHIPSVFVYDGQVFAYPIESARIGAAHILQRPLFDPDGL